MLAFLLAILVGIAGLALMSTAFFFPGLYQKNDIVWGGVALFYALVLWICAQRITGAVLLGQTASVALTGWLGWQALLWRWSKLPTTERSTIADGSTVKQGLEKLKTTDWKNKLQSSSQKLKTQVGESVKGAASATGELAKSQRKIAKKTTPATDPGTDPAVAKGEAEESSTAATASIDTAKAVSSAAQATQADVAEAAAETMAETTAKPVETAKVSVEETQGTKGADVKQTAAAGLGAVTGALGNLRDRLQGRKNHGKKYVRSDKTESSQAAAPPTDDATEAAAWESPEPAQNPTVSNDNTGTALEADIALEKDKVRDTAADASTAAVEPEIVEPPDSAAEPPAVVEDPVIAEDPVEAVAEAEDSVAKTEPPIEEDSIEEEPIDSETVAAEDPEAEITEPEANKAEGAEAIAAPPTPSESAPVKATAPAPFHAEAVSGSSTASDSVGDDASDHDGDHGGNDVDEDVDDDEQQRITTPPPASATAPPEEEAPMAAIPPEPFKGDAPVSSAASDDDASWPPRDESDSDSWVDGEPEV